MAAQIQTSQSSIMQDFAKHKAEGHARMAAIETKLESIQTAPCDAADADGAPRQDPQAAFGASSKTA
eukprot:5455737-Pyramimonas_sp.AAC.1